MRDRGIQTDKTEKDKQTSTGTHLNECGHGAVGSHTQGLFVAHFKLCVGALSFAHDVAAKVFDPVGEADAVRGRADGVDHEAQTYPDITLHEAKEKLDVVGLEVEFSFMCSIDARHRCSVLYSEPRYIWRC